MSQGFVVLYAVLVITVVVLVGVAMMNILAKQLVISSLTQNAKSAYYAALSGYECASYWKNAYDDNYFGSINDAGAVVVPKNSSITCNGDPIPLEPQSSGGVVTTNFRISDDANKTCADVTVILDSGEDPINYLVVNSVGYNVACSALVSGNPRKVSSVINDKKN